MVPPHSLAEVVAEAALKHLRDDLCSATVQAFPIIDHYGEEGFHVRVVYDGQLETPNPRMMKSLYLRMRPDLVKHGIEGLVTHSFIDKAEDTLGSGLGPAAGYPESHR